MDADRIRGLGQRPISEAEPAGENARYDAEYEQVMAEMAKLESIDQQRVDWYQVQKLSAALLETRTKDFKLATWMAMALWRESGLQGLAAGVELCRDLMANFWDGMFPPAKRERARMTMLEWLAEAVEKDFAHAEGDADPAQRDGFERALQAFESLDSMSRDRFTEDQPSLGPAIRALRSRLDSIPAPASEPEPESITSWTQDDADMITPWEQTPAPASAPAAPPPPAEMSSVEDVDARLPDLRAELRKAADVLTAAEPANPRGYRLRRQAVWADLQAPLEPGPGPGVDLLERLDALLAEDDYEEAFAACEEQLAQTPLWLDPLLYTSRCLEGLGKKYRRVRVAVEQELAHLLRRFPELPDQAFDDRQPVCRKDTKVWLANEILTSEGPQGSEVADLAKEARALLARKQIGEAVTLLVRNIERAAGRRTRFLLRLELARLCLDAGNAEMAVPQLDLLEQEVTSFSLEEWEPELSVQVVRLLWQCCKGADSVSTLAERAPAIYERLCRLDPAAALTMERP